MLYVGVDLAWGEGSAARAPQETGLAVLDGSGAILDAGWVRGIDATVDWLLRIDSEELVVAVDAPLVVHNAVGMRECEREVAQRYGRWRVAANASNLTRAWLGGVTLRRALESHGFGYADGVRRTTEPRVFFECYPYTTLVGMTELGYDVERPRYKRLIPGLSAPEARRRRADSFDELIRRVGTLAAADPPLVLASHPLTRRLLEEPSTPAAAAHKHREDLLDGVLCAWTAAIWHRAPERTQVLGAADTPDADGRRPTIIAPARAEQRR